MYDRLSKTLARLIDTEDEIQIEKVYLLKVGCFRFTAYDDQELNSTPLPITYIENLLLESSPEQPKLPVDLIEQVVQALEQHSNLFDIKIDENEDAHFAVFSRMGGLELGLVAGKTFTLHVQLPARMQTFSLHGGDAIENFEAASNGSIFIAFAPIEDYPTRASIGQEYRDLFINQIDNKTQWQCPALGPVPMHPDIYLVFTSSANEGSAWPEIFCHRGDLFLVSDRSPDEYQTIVKTLPRSTHFDLLDFYLQVLANTNLRYYHREITSLFHLLADAVNGLSETPRWKLWRHASLTKEARSNLSTIYERLIEFQESSLHYERARVDFLKRIAEHPVLSKITDYFEDHSRNDTVIPDSFTHALSYFEKEIQTLESTRSAMLAGLGGAVLGSVIATLLTFFLAKGSS